MIVAMTGRLAHLDTHGTEHHLWWWRWWHAAVALSGSSPVAA
jgi:hypothetical protein